MFSKLMQDCEHCLHRITAFIPRASNYRYSNFENVLDPAIDKLKNILSSSIPKFVDKLTFIESKDLFKIDNFIYLKVFDKIHRMYSTKEAKDLFNLLDQEESFGVKKKQV